MPFTLHRGTGERTLRLNIFVGDGSMLRLGIFYFKGMDVWCCWEIMVNLLTIGRIIETATSISCLFEVYDPKGSY